MSAAEDVIGPARGRRRELAAVAALLALGAALALPGLFTNAVTVDEFAHLPAGYVTLTGGRFDVYPKTPPLVRALQALPWLLDRPALAATAVADRGDRFAWQPWRIGDDLMRRNAAIYDRLFHSARLVALGFALLTGLLLWRWARALHGGAAALLALALWVTTPTVLAHGSVATVDAGATGLFLLALVCLRRFVLRPGPARGAALGLALAAGVGAKLTALALLAVIPAVTFCCWLARRWRDRGGEERGVAGGRGAGTRAYLAGAAAAAGVALLGLNLLYGCRGTLEPWATYRPFSSLFGAVQRAMPSALPTLLPRDFLAGLDAQQSDLEGGEFSSYIAGRWSRAGHRGYYLRAFAWKEPLPFLLLLATSAAWYRRPARRELAGELCVWVPVLLLLAAAELGRLQSGIRYLLPIYPLLCLQAGKVAALAAHSPRGRRGLGAAITILVALQAAETWRLGPDHLSYFNALAGGPMRGHELLLESNLDWGQDVARAARWCAAQRVERPYVALFTHVDPRLVYDLDFAPPPPRPGPGVYVVSANYLHGLPYPMTYAGVDAGRISVSWLAAQRPIARVGRSVFVFRIEDAAAVISSAR